MGATIDTRCMLQRTGLGAARTLSQAIVMTGKSFRTASSTIIAAVTGWKSKITMASVMNSSTRIVSAMRTAA